MALKPEIILSIICLSIVAEQSLGKVRTMPMWQVAFSLGLFNLWDGCVGLLLALWLSLLWLWAELWILLGCLLLATLCGSQLSSLPIHLPYGIGLQVWCKVSMFLWIHFGLVLSVGGCMQECFLLTWLPWISPCKAWICSGPILIFKVPVPKLTARHLLTMNFNKSVTFGNKLSLPLFWCCSSGWDWRRNWRGRQLPWSCRMKQQTQMNVSRFHSYYKYNSN